MRRENQHPALLARLCLSWSSKGRRRRMTGKRKKKKKGEEEEKKTKKKRKKKNVFVGWLLSVPATC